MNRITPLSSGPRCQRRGIALVITLLLLVLLSAFAVAFFTRMSVEQVSAASYADGVTTRQLAESAVGLVESQIREATTIPNAAWASQPGMIRTYGKAASSGATAGRDAYAFYKLYSSDNMTITDQQKMEAYEGAADIDEQWASKPALWTDLNEPVRLRVTDPADQTRQKEVPRYPIFDPGLAAKSDMTDPNSLSQHNTTTETKIEGYSIDSEDATTKNRSGRMPVRWIYVLRDGSLTAPTGGGSDGKKATWTESDGVSKVPTMANPIVGRIAFWTDDDTSKVNINTAGGATVKDINKTLYDTRSDDSFTGFAGSYWDVPRFYTKFERGGDLNVDKFGEPKDGTFSLALSQPAGNEFQRFPGHPATTSLALIFNRSVDTNGTVDPKTPRLSSQQLYRLLPRLSPGGSEGGTDRLLARNDTGGAYQTSDDRLALKAQRLYQSVDEFFFAANQVNGRRQTANEFLRTADTTDPKNPIPPLTGNLITTNDLDEYQGYRFFLTAHSRAPELNLYGRPRVSIWPVWAGKEGGVDYSSRRNPIDRLMMFCSTLGPAPKADSTGSTPAGKLFMFQRWQPYDAYTDIGIARNSYLLMKYLSGGLGSPGLTDQPIPGFTEKATFASKYNGNVDSTGHISGSRDQILSEIFDYIRAGVNLHDTYFDRDPQYNPTGAIYGNLPAAAKAQLDKFRYAPRGVVVPAAVKYSSPLIASSRGKEVAGFGRFPTVSEVSLVFYHAGYVGLKDQIYWDPRLKNAYGVKEILMRMFLLVEGYNPMQGYCRTEDTSVDDRNLKPSRVTYALEIGTQPDIVVPVLGGTPVSATMNFPGGTVENEVLFRSGSFAGGNDAGGMEGALHMFGSRFTEPASGPEVPPYPPGASATQSTLNNGGTIASSGVYGFQSTRIVRVPVHAVQGEPKVFEFKGMNATLRVKFGTLEIQNFKINFPAATAWPMPTDAYWEDPGGFAWPHDDVFAYVNGSYAQHPSRFNTSWSGRGSDPWASGLLQTNLPDGTVAPCYPAAMKSLAHRIWWINNTYAISGRAYSGQHGKFDTKGKELFDAVSRGFRFDNRWRNIIQSGDTVRSLVPAPAENTDIRTIAITRKANGDSAVFEPLMPGYQEQTLRHVQANVPAGYPDYVVRPPILANSFAAQSQILRAGSGQPFVFSNTATLTVNGNVSPTNACSIEPRRLATANGQVNYTWERISYGPLSSSGGRLAFGNLVDLGGAGKVGDYGARAADLPALQKGLAVDHVTTNGGKQGDFDTGYGDKPDGALCNKPDEGQLIWRVDNTSDDHTAVGSVSSDWLYRYPYFISEYNDDPTGTFFSPSRQMPSAAMFGSLLVGTQTNWQTLCFSPNPASLTASTPSGMADHPGFDVEPRDHLLLDLFSMPVVEPYAISEPFSTAGKINLNCEIVPFSYIHRTTALRAALAPVRITAVPADQAKIYKTGSPAGTPLNRNFRLQLDRDETVKEICAIFSSKTNSKPASDRFYKSASQICERFLYPALESDGAGSGDSSAPKWDRNQSNIRRFWAKNVVTGDNVREKPYADLYPRLTTKSNTYTVHVRVQKLRPQKGQNNTAFLTWNETEDCVAAEYRGEVQIERYLDPQDKRFITDAADTTVPADEQFDVDSTRYIATAPKTRPLEFAYRYRTVSSKRFSPDR